MQKMEFGKKNHEMDLFDFTSFFAWTFSNFLAHCMILAFETIKNCTFSSFWPTMQGGVKACHKAMEKFSLNNNSFLK